MWNLKYDTNEHIYGRETDSLIWRADLWFTRGRDVRGGRTESLGLADKLLYIEQISNRVLLCHRGNYSQYPVINHHGKEYEKVYIYIYTRN